ncbi:hypothetical protein EAL2_c14920 [Peptoclostridium acidaminophilum DSM 3953]|uniref:HlyD family secretion protein n=1 Tax=Peptoclostridium acidaminophilum DSM 3953 TaxID=1286171 RepID=W8TKR2_PEPAC|nr:HlyD family efflux transporter periplasmic adaptor subunit [Peptoclostridium acidaminophilum]AHM56787.1 hypothetical protein EAL2_c14920 [Peptoclostridium acidaminophilum DSM 3953]
MGRKKRRAQRKIFNYLIFMGIFSYIVFNLVMSIINSSIQTHTVKKGQIVEYLQKDGYAVRQESVFYTSIGGIPKYLHNEGDRISINDYVCEIQTNEADQMLRQEADTIARRLEVVSSGGALAGVTPEKLDRGIEVKRKEIKNSITMGAFDSVERLKKELLFLMDEKSILYGSLSGQDSGMLQKKADAIQAKIQSSSRVIPTTISGVLSFQADGFEGSMTPAEIGKIDSDFLKTLSNNNVIKKDGALEKGDPAFKIANNHFMYLLFIVNEKENKELKVGQGIYVKSGKETVYCVIKDMYKDSQGKSIMVFKTASVPAEFLDKRILGCSIVTKNVSGIKIPKAAIATLDGKQGVYVISETGQATFKEIKCQIGENEEHIILDYKRIEAEKIDTAKLYDEIIMNPKRVKEGQKIR